MSGEKPFSDATATAYLPSQQRDSLPAAGVQSVASDSDLAEVRVPGRETTDNKPATPHNAPPADVTGIGGGVANVAEAIACGLDYARHTLLGCVKAKQEMAMSRIEQDIAFMESTLNAMKEKNETKAHTRNTPRRNHLR